MDTYRELCELTLIFKEDPLFVVEVKRDLIPRATGGPREFTLNCYTKLQYFSGVPIKCPLGIYGARVSTATSYSLSRF